jgi:hypothetical protein
MLSGFAEEQYPLCHCDKWHNIDMIIRAMTTEDDFFVLKASGDGA